MITRGYQKTAFYKGGLLVIKKKLIQINLNLQVLANQF